MTTSYRVIIIGQVIMEMGFPYSEMEIASFMSCSKGYMGECGMRGKNNGGLGAGRDDIMSNDFRRLR